MKKKKNIIMILFLIVSVGVTLAYFTSTASLENEFNSGKYKTVTEEEFVSPSNWLPGQTIPKTVITTNEGTIPVRVRVSFEETLTSENGDELDFTIPVFHMGENPSVVIINLTNDLYWDYVDGYYYYVEELMPGDSTLSLMESVTLNPNVPSSVNCSNDGGIYTCESTGDGYDGATYNLKIITETVQSDGVVSAWGLDSDPISPTYYYSSYDDALLYDIAFGEDEHSMLLNRSEYYLLDNTYSFDNYEDVGSEIFFVHTIRSGVVRMEGVGFIYDDNMYVLNYGGEIPCDYDEIEMIYICYQEDNKTFLRNKNVLLDAFGSEACEDDENSFSCLIDDYDIKLLYNGDIEVELKTFDNHYNFAYIYSDGSISGGDGTIAVINPPHNPNI